MTSLSCMRNDLDEGQYAWEEGADQHDLSLLNKRHGWGSRLIWSLSLATMTQMRLLLNVSETFSSWGSKSTWFLSLGWTTWTRLLLYEGADQHDLSLLDEQHVWDFFSMREQIYTISLSWTNNMCETSSQWGSRSTWSLSLGQTKTFSLGRGWGSRSTWSLSLAWTTTWEIKFAINKIFFFFFSDG